MFNVAVVNKKDILKYLVSITITLCTVMFVTRYFSNLGKEGKNQIELDKKVSEIMQTSLLVCLDETIPAIKETNHELNNSDEDQINENDILGNLLKIELAMFKEEQKIAEIQNSASNQIETPEVDSQENQTQNQSKNQNQENQNVEVSRKCYNRSSNAKSVSRQIYFRISKCKNKK